MDRENHYLTVPKKHYKLIFWNVPLTQNPLLPGTLFPSCALQPGGHHITFFLFFILPKICVHVRVCFYIDLDALSYFVSVLLVNWLRVIGGDVRSLSAFIPDMFPFLMLNLLIPTVCLEKLKTRSPRLHCLIRSHTSSMSTSDYTEAVSVTTTRDPCRHTSLASDQTDRLFSLLLIAVQAWLT